MVEAVNVLGDDGHLPPLRLEPGFQLRNGLVSGIRVLGLHHLTTVAVVDIPVRLLLPGECLGEDY